MKASLALCALAALQSVSATPVDKRLFNLKNDYLPSGIKGKLNDYLKDVGNYVDKIGLDIDIGLKDKDNDKMPKPDNAGHDFKFTSKYHVVATPDQVVSGDDNPQKTGGLPGTKGFYDLAINSDKDVICYNIVLIGFRGEYQSAANTATHVHEGAKGQTGPPRVVFPNPQGKGLVRISRGCLQ
ncbi:MAG: hypothetical protein Q9183_006914, partial [Haloplaca sp. 2 TL-2023]